MRILMMTNTYKPVVGGVTRAIESIREGLVRRGHRVLIVAPEFEHAPRREKNVVRLPAVTNFNGSVFSASLPVPGLLTRTFREFDPDVVHAHHPFLLGDTAMRLARVHGRPLVLTYHTVYEKYAHYVPGDSPRVRRFIIGLTSGFADMCDSVIVPSRGIEAMLRRRGVAAPIQVIPTGIELRKFSGGDGARAREKFGIPGRAWVAGVVSRITEEKNMLFLAEAAARYLAGNRRAHVLMVGDGPVRAAIRKKVSAWNLRRRFHLPGTLEGEDLLDAYRAMDGFIFASKSETQGLVLAEAMAAGLPVVGLSATGTDDVVRDKVNGRLVRKGNTGDFTRAIAWLAERSGDEKARLARQARDTARDYSIAITIDRLTGLYEGLKRSHARIRKQDTDALDRTRRLLNTQWDLMSNAARSAVNSLIDS